MRKRINRPSPALVVACMALFVSLGGVGYAAATINGADIQNKTIAGKKLKNKTVTGGKVKSNTLTGTQINESKLGRVPSATSATTAGSAGTAGTAGLANSIADNTVTSAKVVKGSLTGADVGRKAGTSTIDFDPIALGACDDVIADIDPTNTDLRDAAFAMTVEQTWPDGLVFSTENSDSPGLVRINVCNVDGTNPVDPGNQVIHWVAFAI